MKRGRKGFAAAEEADLPDHVPSTGERSVENLNHTLLHQSAEHKSFQDVVFCFDFSDSMKPFMDQVVKAMTVIVGKLSDRLPGIRLGYIAHSNTKKFETFDLSEKLNELCMELQKSQISSVLEPVGEWQGKRYNVMLRAARESFSWRDDAQKLVVVFGYTWDWEVDEDYSDTPLRMLHWVWEAERNKETNIHIHGCQVETSKPDVKAETFFRELAEKGGGKHVKVTSHMRVNDVITGVCLREGGDDTLANFEKELREGERGDLNGDLELMLQRLKDRSRSAHSEAEDEEAKATGNQPKKSRLETSEVKQNREEVADADFILRDLKWSTWETCAVDQIDNQIYYPHRIKDASQETLYEVAVKLKEDDLRYVVYFGVPDMRKKSVYWHDYLLDKRTKLQLAEVLDQQKGCRILLRKLPVTQTRLRIGDWTVQGIGEMRWLLDKTYDYAWANKINCPCRDVVRCGAIISSGAPGD